MSRKIEDHAEQCLALLIHQYQDLPDLEAWIRSYLYGLQEIEDAAWEVILSRDVDHATGDALHQIGKKVGRRWQGESTENYRALLKAQIAVNRSHGQWKDLNKVAAILFPSKSRRWVRHRSMNLTLVIDDQLTSSPDIEQELIEAAADAGGRVDIKYSTDPASQRFAFGPEGGGFGDGGWSSVSSSQGATE